MKRIALLCLLWGCGSGLAQGGFVGGGVSVYIFVPLVSVQAGLEVADRVRLRGNLDSLLIANVLTVDALYTFLEASPAEGSPAVYAGGGAEMVFIFEGPPEERVFFGVHGTIGAEFRQDAFGCFMEVQPSVAFVILFATLSADASGTELLFLALLSRNAGVAASTRSIEEAVGSTAQRQTCGDSRITKCTILDKICKSS